MEAPPARLLRRARLIAVAAACLALGAAPEAGASGPQVGVEFRANPSTTGTQEWPVVARDSGGDFVVVWQAYGQPGQEAGDEYDVIMQRFGADGLPVGGEARVNTTTAGDQLAPDVAMEPDGDFIVVWESAGQDGGGTGIVARRFAADGTGGSEIPVNVFTTGNQSAPAVAVTGNGDALVAWQSHGQDEVAPSSGIFARRFTAAGAASLELAVNTFTAGEQVLPDVGAADGNGFVVVWESFGQDGSDPASGGVRGRRFDASLAPSAEFQVNTFAPGYQGRPKTAVHGASGAFVVVWESYGQDAMDPNLGVFAQRFDAAGEKLGAEFRVNTFTNGEQGGPQVAADRLDDDFLVTWHGELQDHMDGSYGVFSQAYTGGLTAGPEIRVNTYTAGDQSAPAVAIGPGAASTIAWMSWEQDGASWGVFAQRYGDVGVEAATTPATAIGQQAATLNATFTNRANGDRSVTARLEYGTTTEYGQTIQFGPQTIASGVAQPFTAELTGLAPGVTYHFRLVADGVSWSARSADRAFTTATTDPDPDPQPDPEPDPEPQPDPEPEPDPIPGPAPSDPGTGGAPAPVPATADSAAPVTALAIRSQRLRAALVKGLAVRLTTNEPVQVRLTLVIDARTARRAGLGRRATVVGSAARVVRAGGSTIVVRFAARARKRLARLAKLTLKAAATATDAAGNRSAPPRRTVTLRR